MEYLVFSSYYKHGETTVETFDAFRLKKQIVMELENFECDWGLTSDGDYKIMYPEDEEIHDLEKVNAIHAIKSGVMTVHQAIKFMLDLSPLIHDRQLGWFWVKVIEYPKDSPEITFFTPEYV